MEVTNEFLYFTTNIFVTGTNDLAGAVIARLPLDALAAGQPVDTPEYAVFRYTPGGQYNFSAIAPVNGAQYATDKNTIYFGAYIDSTSMAVLRWRDGETEPKYRRIQGLRPTHTGPFDFSCPGPDTYDPCSGKAVDARIQSGWVTNAEVGFMWHSGRNIFSSDRPYPFVRVLTLHRAALDAAFLPIAFASQPEATITPIPSLTPFNTVTPIPSLTPFNTVTPIPSLTPVNTVTQIPSLTPVNTVTPIPSLTPVPSSTPPSNLIKSDTDIFDLNVGLMWPSVAVNARGELGGTLSSLGGIRHPSIIAMIRDIYAIGAWGITEVIQGSFTPVSGSNPVPALRARTWGDYTDVVAHEKYPNTWIGVGWVWEPDSDIDTPFKARPHNFWFMRSADDTGLLQHNCLATNSYSIMPTPTIPDGGEISYQINVPTDTEHRFTVSRAVVSVFVSHPNVAELNVYLQAPGSNERVELYTGVGAGTTSLNAILYDDASLHIKRAGPPSFGTL